MNGPDSNTPIVRSVGVSKWFGNVTALSDVNLQLEPGIWGLLGPNGSGKTTFLTLLGGLVRPSLGEVRVFGASPFGNPDVLRRIGFCPEADALYDSFTALEMVSALARLSGFSKTEARDRAIEALRTFDLESAKDRKVGGFSRGMRQRVKLAQTFVHDPELILLDEPLTGTDPVSRNTILEVLRARAAAGATIVFSTHVLHEVESVTERVLLIARGRVVAQGNTFEIRNLLDEHPTQIRVECRAPRALARDLIGDEGIVGMELSEGTLELRTSAPDATYANLQRTLANGDYGATGFTSPDATIEALFNYLVERGSRAAGTGADAAVGRARSLGQEKRS